MFIVGRHAYFQLFVIDPRVCSTSGCGLVTTFWTLASPYTGKSHMKWDSWFIHVTLSTLYMYSLLVWCRVSFRMRMSLLSLMFSLMPSLMRLFLKILNCLKISSSLPLQTQWTLGYLHWGEGDKQCQVCLIFASFWAMVYVPDARKPCTQSGTIISFERRGSATYSMCD